MENIAGNYRRVKIVTCTYKDEHKIDWVQRIPSEIPYIVYAKNDRLILGQENVKSSSSNMQRVEIPNFGRCDYAFLYHIVKNYDNLDDITIFVKCNWRDNKIPFWEMVKECVNYDYMTVGTHFETYDWIAGYEEFLSGVESFSENNRHWYKHIFAGSNNTPERVNRWGHGPCFCVSRGIVRRHPKSVYEYLLDRFHPSSKSFDSLGYQKHGFSSYNKFIEDVGISYHNELLRFYTVLFTHNIPDNFRIYEDPKLDSSRVDKPQTVSSVRKMAMKFL